jgi:Holliday junction resolvase RusA-like endonuclease
MPTKTTAGVYDLDKLVRAIGDALEGVCYENDCQIIRTLSEKVWADTRPYVEVAIIEVPA